MCTNPWKFCKFILRLRLSNHKLNIETGRYYNIDRNLRTCENCNMNLIGDEYHLFFNCTKPNVDLFIFHITIVIDLVFIYKYCELMSNLDSKAICINIAKFVKLCNVT